MSDPKMEARDVAYRAEMQDAIERSETSAEVSDLEAEMNRMSPRALDGEPLSLYVPPT